MGMGIWLALGLGAAVGDSGADVVTKRYFVTLPPYGMALARLLAAVPFLVLVGAWLTLPTLTYPFWYIVAGMLPLETAALLLYMRALKCCHLSLCVPFLAFTPVFLILTGWLVLGETLSPGGVAGTLFIALGSYILGLGADGSGRLGLLAPFKALAKERGARLMLLVAALYSCTAALYKAAIQHSGPAFFGVTYPLLFTGLMVTGYPWNRVALRPTLKGRLGWWLILGSFFALSNVTLASGIALAPAAYLVAVKRLSLLMSVILGGVWLQERPFLPRIIGAALMCAGVGLIAWRG
ncbi:MAG: DMT family transporter [Syntrophobacterales bacterium]|jgi:drug/metabolite transporter (DMT)-like permease|nr:DMT family transporter [Syntrophobacterales bacterium]